MKVFSEKVKVKKSDGNYTLSVAVTDKTIIITELTDKEMRMLRRDIEKILKEDD